jgi:uncharacterized membrane protein
MSGTIVAMTQVLGPVLDPVVRRRPVPTPYRPQLLAWVDRLHSWPGRISSDYTVAALFAALLVVYLLTGRVAVGVLTLVLIVAFVPAVAFWGGVRAWERRNVVPAATNISDEAGVEPVDRARPPRLPAYIAGVAALWIGPEIVLRLSRRRKSHSRP